MPVHAGHQLLIDHAVGVVGESGLTVIVGTQPGEPIPGALRVAWVRELYPRVAVVHLDATMPQEPADHPDFWKLWVAAIRQFVPDGPDLVFTSEAYGDQLARRLGAQHVAVDPSRVRVPVSGTAIRARPLECWRYLPPPVRAYYARRVVLYGAESTGKTTLARRLAERFGTVWVPEFGREYLDRKAPADPLAAFSPDDVPVIAAGQVAAEDRLAREANRLLFCDTDLLTTRVYSELYFGSCPQEVVAEGMRRPYQLYVWLTPDSAHVADAQRRGRHRDPGVVRRFGELLVEKGAPFVEVGGSWEERFERAAEAVGTLIPRGDAEWAGCMPDRGI